MLSSQEHQEFYSIVHSARNEGWLDDKDQMAFTASPVYVVVTRTRDESVQHKRYSRSPRWLYEFLRDLATGEFRAHAAAAQAS